MDLPTRWHNNFQMISAGDWESGHSAVIPVVGAEAIITETQMAVQVVVPATPEIQVAVQAVVPVTPEIQGAVRMVGPGVVQVAVVASRDLVSTRVFVE